MSAPVMPSAWPQPWEKERSPSSLSTARWRNSRRQADENMHAHGSDQEYEATRSCLRRVHENGRHLGASEVVHDVWSRGLLRFVKEQACDEAFSRCEAPDREVHRAWGRLGMVL